jgi:hypothetical protein
VPSHPSATPTGGMCGGDDDRQGTHDYQSCRSSTHRYTCEGYAALACRDDRLASWAAGRDRSRAVPTVWVHGAEIPRCLYCGAPSDAAGCASLMALIGSSGTAWRATQQAARAWLGRPTDADQRRRAACTQPCDVSAGARTVAGS